MIGVAVKDGQPTVVGSGLPVAAIVHACHEKTIDVGLAELAIPGLDRASLEPILTYCAERRCEADDATCPGCRLRMEKLDINSLDEFVARHAEITFEDSPVRLRGTGTDTLTAPSLEHLAKTWAGEEYWFWARRVIRKLRHGLRRAGQTGAAPIGVGETPVMILVRPQLADNIGMVSRAMANFGLEHLRLVSPRDGWPNEKARIAASGANLIVDAAQAYPTLAEGLAALHWVCATTARQRDLAKPVLTPEQAVAEMRRRIGAGQRCGILFGPERNGLETEEIANADAAVMAPVNPNFASLNLAQAALLMGYEWMKAGTSGTLGRVTTYEQPVQPGLRTRGSPPATKEELMGFFEQLERELEAQGFFNPPEKRPSMVQNMRTMFTRMEATEQEIRTLRGIVKALVHAKRTGRRSP
ncbi:MAG TPA: RNA methyltransferase [Hyphomicrobiaceae bacterium]|nr:RNA methyltransferase [Hyphomicrobiaceae bacterium]